MTSAELIAALQAQGYGTSLTAGQWTQAAEDAVRMYSRQRPRYVLGTLTVAAGVEEYDLPAGGYLCLEVAPYDALSDIDETSTLSQAMAQGDVIIDFHQPSQVDMYRQKLEHWSRQFGPRWEQDAPGAKVRLMPPPETAGTLAIFYSVPHATAETVPTGDVDLLLLAGQAVATRVMAVGAAVSVVSSGGRLTLGPYTRDTGGIGTAAKVLMDESERLEQRFLDAAGLPAAAMRA